MMSLDAKIYTIVAIISYIGLFFCMARDLRDCGFGVFIIYLLLPLCWPIFAFMLPFYLTYLLIKKLAAAWLDLGGKS